MRPQQSSPDRALEVLAVIPARAGSKGLVGKNLRQVAGLSLVGHAVRAATESTLVTRVAGSTDGEAIAEEFRRVGAEVPGLRPAELAADDTPDAPVFHHVLEVLFDRDGYRPDIVVNVRPTAPLRTGRHIDEAIDALLAAPHADSVKSVSPAGEHPYKMWTLGPDRLEPLLPEWHARFGGDPDIARQRLPVVLKSNGAVDAVRVDAFLRSDRFHPGVVVPYVMDADAAIDIDTADDLALAESLLGQH